MLNRETTHQLVGLGQLAAGLGPLVLEGRERGHLGDLGEQGRFSRQASACDLQVLGRLLDADAVGTLLVSGDRRAAASQERVEHRAANGRDQPAQPAHEGERLDRGVIVTLAALLAGCLGLVEEAGGGAGVAVALD